MISELLNPPSLLTSFVLPDAIFPQFNASVFENCIELSSKKMIYTEIKLSSETSSVASFPLHYANRYGLKGEDNNSIWKTLLFNQISN